MILKLIIIKLLSFLYKLLIDLVLFSNIYIFIANEKSVVDYMGKNYPKTFIYPDFARDFTAEFFNATEWAEIFANSGAK